MESNYINFRPHFGNNYSITGFRGKKILVLGESHYCLRELCEEGRCYPRCNVDLMKEDCHSQTEDVVDGFIYEYDGSKYYQTFLCFERAILGKELSQEEREEFWEGVIFYNYLQFSQPGPRQPIIPDYLEQSELAFKQLVETYLPDYIIAWGVRLYNRMPDWGGEHSVLAVDGHSTDIWYYSINGKSIPMIKVHHPSTPTGKDWAYWHKFYQVFLNL